MKTILIIPLHCGLVSVYGLCAWIAALIDYKGHLRHKLKVSERC